MVLPWLAALAAYLLGSLSFAVIVSRAMGLSDPRSYGSGNPGATNVLRSGSKKAAIATLLRSMDLPVEVVSAIYIAGGIGTNINIRNAIRLGMLPDIPEETYYYIGNSSVQGAYLALTLNEGKAKTEEIAHNMTYIELSADPAYMDDFLSACFIPHTDRSLFPSSDI